MSGVSGPGLSLVRYQCPGDSSLHYLQARIKREDNTWPGLWYDLSSDIIVVTSYQQYFTFDHVMMSNQFAFIAIMKQSSAVYVVCSLLAGRTWHTSPSHPRLVTLSSSPELIVMNKVFPSQEPSDLLAGRTLCAKESSLSEKLCLLSVWGCVENYKWINWLISWPASSEQSEGPLIDLFNICKLIINFYDHLMPMEWGSGN